MTATDSDPATDTWAAELDQLHARYKHVRPPILAALNILMHNENISNDEAKAQAALHGVKITAASISAAQRLLSRQDGAPAAPTAAIAAPSTTPRTRRDRPAAPATDADALIRGLVAKLQSQGNAETERLRGAVHKAIVMLQAAVGS